MSNLLNSVAAAAGSIARRNSGGPFVEKTLTGMTWLYRNLCWYGMQIQRYTHRCLRTIKKLARPFGALISRYISRPVLRVAHSIGDVFADARANFALINAARKKGGVAAMAKATSEAASRGAVKYRTFFRSAVNYCLPVLCIAVMLLVAYGLFGRTYVLAVEYDGHTIGYIEDESTYTDATELISERVISSSEDFQNALRPSYTLTSVGSTEQLSNSEELCNTILVASDDVSEAFGLFVDDRLIGAISSEGDMTYILDKYLEKFRMGVSNETITLVGESKIISGLYANDKIMDSASFQDFLGATEKSTEVYTIKNRDTLESIADKFDMTTERILELNDGFDGTVAAGRSLLVEQDSPVIEVKNLVITTSTATIPFKTETVKDPNKLTSYSKVTTKGSNGTKRITTQTTYINGVQQGSPKQIKTEIITPAVNKVVVVGTKKPATVTYGNYTGSLTITGTGRFTWPLPGVSTVSSKYGYRWGRLHAGIDISTGGVYGRTIVAADSGTVTTVKNSPSGYGLHVIISHGNGYTTLYAHCSKILVSVGEKVSKGQAIAKVGNSGRSTGAHLHFEIRVNGTAKNPLNWF